MLWGILNRIADIAGAEAAERLALYAGGQGKKYIPQPETITSDHWLAIAVGLDAAIKIARNIGEERLIHIPLGGTGARGSLHREIIKLSRSGYSNAQIARNLRIDESTVRRHIGANSKRDDKQLSLL